MTKNRPSCHPKAAAARGTARARRPAWLALALGLCLTGSTAPADPPFADPAGLLRAALDARDNRSPAEAEWLLTEVSIRHPIVADHADLLRAQLLLDTDQPGEAVGVLLESLQRHRTSPLRTDFYQLLGDARSDFGDREAARSAWRSALEATSDSERKAAMWRKIALSFEAEEKWKEAGAAWLKIWTDFPTADGAREVGSHLDAAEARLGTPLRNASDWRHRGDRLFLNRHNESALDAYDHALASGLEATQARRARLQRAHTLFRLRRYDEAARAFASLPQEDDVRLWYARSLARSGEVPSSVQHFEKLAADSRSEIGIRARFLAALLLEGKGQGDRAREYFQNVAAAARYPGLSSAARWRLGWAAYLAGRWGESVGYLEGLVEDEDPIDALRARYWRARALEHQGAPSARPELEALARDYPLTYYGWRARQLLDESPAGEGGRPADGRAALSGADLARPQILLQAGLRDAALEEMARIESRARGLADRLALARLYTDAGDFNRAQRLMVDAYQEPLARGPLPGLEDPWRYAWPMAYSDLVARATATPDSVPKELVYSIMREESGYRPKVLSVSGARGLLQIMEPTGRRLAAALGLQTFAADDLFEPEVNIDLGSHYLSELSQRFPERLSAAIASYNAGPNAVSSWIEKDGRLADDEWVESIPYDQTRSYVKRVLRSLYAYSVLY